MAENILPVKYIFLDVVGFTHKRSVDAQSDVVSTLNVIVANSLEDSKIPVDNRIYLPTGDGICIALVNIDSLPDIGTPYDAHIRIALDILDRLKAHNTGTDDDQRKFEVRVGINENIDNVVTDINGNRNVAGDGINMCQRVMSLADGNQILVSASVFGTVGVREKYFQDSFKELPIATIKHGKEIKTYQLITENQAGLNTELPEHFQSPKQEELRLTEFASYYFAHAIKNEKFLLSKGDSINVEYGGVALLYFYTKDSMEFSKHNAIDVFKPEIKNFGDTIEEQYKYFKSINAELMFVTKSLIFDKHLSQFKEYFEYNKFKLRSEIFINLAGKEKLKTECPDIWTEFQLDN
jgi:class 3 adenylate cyclase